ncbi:MAG: hypothetical protein ACNYWU_08165, partial [Desulfobacterales bacterium]
MIASTFERYQTIDQNNHFGIYSEGIYYCPFALLIRGTEHAEGFILFLFKILSAFFTRRKRLRCTCGFAVN